MADEGSRDRDAHDHEHGHEHGGSELSEMDLRVRTLESLLVEKGYVDPKALDALIETYETKVGPHNGARVVAKAWELLGKAESDGDTRGAIVALREVRECLESLNNLVTKAEGGSSGIAVTVEYIGTAPSPEPKTRTAPNNQRPAQPAAASRAVLPASSPTDA